MPGAAVIMVRVLIEVCFTGGVEMNVRQIIGICIILGAYGLTWFFLLRSLRIVKIIDREGLQHAGEIKARLKGKRRGGGPGTADERSATGGQDPSGEGDTKGP
jgi:hypothetical protein